MDAASPHAGATPAERLTLSRERLRLAMLAPAADNGAGGSPGGSAWLHGLKGLHGLDAAWQAVRAWWAQHPLHNAALLVSEVAKGIVQPMAQRHPLGLLAGAVVFGSLLVWTRPWRWVLTPALFAGLLPQLIAKVMGQMPPEAWLGLMASLARKPVHQNSRQTPEQASAPNAATL